ncbi:MAG: hypothetical protein J5644_01260 [Bacteroidales bacterium]|nr:hypothetical protein [Bacteroidales bacterium]
MKKLLVIALVAVFALSLSSCGNREKTNTEKITTAKGWVLKSATVTPAVADYGTDWYANYLLDYEYDDVIVFNTNGSFIIKPGNKVPGETEDGYTEEKASNWEFNADETKVKMQIPFFYDLSENPARTFNAQFEEPTISSLSETEMVLIYETNMDLAKGNVHTFTLTYEAVK